MGGPAGGDPTHGIWSPAGGWYPDPKHWRRNTGFAFLAAACIAIPVFFKSAQLEVHHGYPSRPIPSQLWCKNFPPKPEEKKASSESNGLADALTKLA